MLDPLREEHELLQALAKRNRAEFAKSTDSEFARNMREAMDGYLRMRADGVSREDACKGLEECIRGYWPKPSTKFPQLCDLCLDTGWRFRVCYHEIRCCRRSCAEGHPAREHVYVEFCDCAAGDKFKPRAFTAESEIAAVGKTRKKKPSWSRVGH